MSAENIVQNQQAIGALLVTSSGLDAAQNANAQIAVKLNQHIENNNAPNQ